MALVPHRGRDWAAAIAGLIGFATVVAYLIIVFGQDGSDHDYPLVAFVTLFFTVLSAASIWSNAVELERRVAYRSASAVGFLFWGLIAAASIGTPLLVAGLIALVGLIRTLQESPQLGLMAALAGFGAVAVGILGLVVANST